MSSAGIHKPPVAPKPRQYPNQRTEGSPQPPRADGPPPPSAGVPRKAKPPVAPKPCLKPPAAGESKAQSSESLRSNSDTLPTAGLNSQNGLQQSKKPEWGYIIPICLCSRENCSCAGSAKSEQKERNVKTSPRSDRTEAKGKPVPATFGKQDDGQVKRGTAQRQAADSSSTNNHKLREGFDDEVNSDGTGPEGTAALSPPHRTRSDRNTDAVLQGVAGGRQESDGFGSEHTDVLQHKPVPGPFRKAPPVPERRKPRAAAPSYQEAAANKQEETPVEEGRETSAVPPPNGKASSSPSIGVSVGAPSGENNPPACLSVERARPVPAPTPRKKPFLPDTTKAPAPAAQQPPEDARDVGTKEPASRASEEVAKKARGDQEGAPRCPPSTLPGQTESSEAPAADRGGTGRPVQNTHCRRNSALVLMQSGGSAEKRDAGKSQELKPRQASTLSSDVLKQLLSRDLPSPPVEQSAGSRKRFHSSPKKKSKSLSSADLCSDGQKGSGFLKTLDLKVHKKKKKAAKEEENPYLPAADLRGACGDREQTPPWERTLPSPLTGVEQSVDGDELVYDDAEPACDDAPVYEEISDYKNVFVAKPRPSPLPAGKKARPSPVYDDVGIYEEQEPYLTLAKNAQLIRPPAEFDRSSGDEEDGAVPNGSFSEDDAAANSSVEEDGDDSSSVSSKGDPEQMDGSAVKSATKKSNIHFIATEIMTSESVFVDVLKLLHVDFRESVKKVSQQSGKPVIEERLLNQILYYLPQLYELNQNLLKELKERVAEWDENSQVADIFLKKGPFLKMYSTYIREFDKNVALLDEQTKKNSAFGAVVKDFEASPRCANLALSHYLLKPVQRIPQYQLLLTDYLKNLSEDSSDYKDTQAALALVKEVANHANNIMKHGDNFQKLMQVQCCFNGHHEIVQPGRIFLKEGVLMKRSRKVMQPAKFFLFNDALLYAIPVQSGQYKLKNMLSLAGMKVSKPSQEAYQNELNIESVERSFILSASSASERDEWLEAISTAISEHTKKKISFIAGNQYEEPLENVDDGAPLGSKAPIWIPDLRTTMCMICTSEFTLTWRRHHCRACGKVVCQVCSTNKCPLAYKKNEPARVCDECFNTLQNQKRAIDSAAAATPGSRSSFAFSRKQKKIPAALKEVTANTGASSMSGYLTRSKPPKKQGKKLWFVIKDKVLYTYAASEDVAALESQPLLGFALKTDSLQKTQFKLYHQGTLYYAFKADDVPTYHRWIKSFKDATVL
ncbi:FYVE, RhoGEF and PH domain-containing protein 6 isoform X2 [Kryptolebias marmoratus]|uniref:FYVE, RhoGEF and PH domain-containing protein 6 isoform X2 n=1 Tax=Kryptolebias marmoratus TaxID=37003 RepID=UPI0007F89E32|nr:FYVE, RhoGEF and PH domain-containing protein 6 isoform X2 [Kryptolebias marmoratus]